MNVGLVTYLPTITSAVAIDSIRDYEKMTRALFDMRLNDRATYCDITKYNTIK